VGQQVGHHADHQAAYVVFFLWEAGQAELVTTPTLLPTGTAAAFLAAAHVVQVAVGAAVGDLAGAGGAGGAYVATL
jgi:hypothetical protein